MHNTYEVLNKVLELTKGKMCRGKWQFTKKNTGHNLQEILKSFHFFCNTHNVYTLTNNYWLGFFIIIR